MGLAAHFSGGARGVVDDDVHYLWPENVRAWDLWLGVQTQWRVGVQGSTGLDYAGVGRWIDEQAISGDERRHVWACIRAAESAVLEVLNDETRRTAPRG